MNHTIIWLGRLSLNFQRLHDRKKAFTILRADDKGTAKPDEPSAKVNGIVFGYMQEGKQKFFAVKVDEVILNSPLRLVPQLHMKGKDFGPKYSIFDDQLAKRLIGDAIAKNPKQETELMKVYDRYFAAGYEYSLPEEIADLESLYEGTKHQILVNSYERNPEARRKCITHYGTSCVVYGFNFAEKYGNVGVDFMRVHHLRELAGIGEKYEVDPIKDLRPVCPNCHAIIHRRKPAYGIEEIKKFMQQVTH